MTQRHSFRRLLFILQITIVAATMIFTLQSSHAQEQKNNSLFLGFNGPQDIFSCADGDQAGLAPDGPQPGLSSMYWTYSYNDAWHWCIKTVAPGLLKDMSRIQLAVKSDRSDPLYLAVEEDGGESFVVAITPTTEWTLKEWAFSSFIPDPQKKQDGRLDPARITKIILVDDAGTKGIKGTRALLFSALIADRNPIKTPSRSYSLGFTRFPPDLTVEAIDQMYDLLGKHADLLAHHFDGGIPWPEAFRNLPFSKHLQEDWERSRAKTPAGHKVYVAVTPLSPTRDGLAPYWGESDNQPLPKPWASYPLDHPAVKTAYVNYLIRVVNFFKPDYLCIGIEPNILLSNHPEHWAAYKKLHQYTYKKLKQKYPNLPIFISIQYGYLTGKEEGSNSALQIKEVKSLLPYMDFLGLSLYPYWENFDSGTEQLFDLAVSFKKTIALAESGFPSANFTVFGKNAYFTEEQQKRYHEFILRKANELNFLFVINWNVMDFERLLAKLPEGFAKELGKVWVYDGLFRDNGTPKPALEVWDRYLRIPRR